MYSHFKVSRKLGYHFLANLNTDLTNLDLALCSYDSMKLVLSALAKESLSHETLSQVEVTLDLLTLKYLTDQYIILIVFLSYIF